MSQAGSGVPTKGPRLWAVYCGGILGPFGSLVTLPMLPEIARDLDTTVTTAATTTTAYLVPFAATLLILSVVRLVWPPSTVLRFAYWVFFVGSVISALASSIEVLLLARCLQGAANALISPSALAILLSSLSNGTGMGRRLGTYGTMQALGQTIAPLVAGACVALADWRLAMGAAAVTGLVLALGLGTASANQQVHTRLSTKDVIGQMRRLLLWSLLGAFAYMSSTSMTLLVPIWLNDYFSAGAVLRGVTVAAFGAAGVAFSRPLGRLADRVDHRLLGACCCFMLIAACLGTAFAPSICVIVVLMALAGASSAGLRVCITALALSRVRKINLASSFQLSVQFFAGGLVPLPLLPLYERDPELALTFMAAGAIVSCIGLALSKLRGWR